MGREVPAVTAVTRHLPDGGTQTIFACSSHRFRTITQLGGQDLDLSPAVPDVHGCKGCLDDWPPDTLTG